MTDIYMADVSEFQGNVDAQKYISAGNECIICRTYNGYRPDNMMPGRRDYLRGQPFTGVGWYAYLEDGVDAVEQAHGFIATIGSLKGNEWPILDLEEGSGDQTGRAQAWFNVVDPWAGFPAMLYAGDAFLKSNLGGAGRWSGRPVWIASYPNSYQPNPGSEPSAAHILWQFSDRYNFAGIGNCDGNIHHGPADEFVSTVRAGKSGGVKPPTQEEIMAISACVADNGTMHVFVEDDKGAVWYTYQPKGKTDWNGGKAGKQIAGLSPFAPAPGK